MKKIVILVSVISLCFACNQQEKKNIGKKPTLNKIEIIEILRTVDTNFNITDKSTYHLGYPLIFNDSTFSLEIAINSVIPSFKQNVTNYIDYNGNNVFIYNGSDLNIEADIVKKEKLSKFEQSSPFFDPNSKSLSLIIQRRNGELILSKMETLLKEDTKGIKTNDTDF